MVLARSRRQLETVVLRKLREFLAARGLRFSPAKTRMVRDTEGFDFVGRQFKRLSPTKFQVRPRRSSIQKHVDTVSTLFRNHALPVGQQIQKANAIIRGFCNHYRTDHCAAVFGWLTNWTLRSFCKWVSRRSGTMTLAKAFRKLTRVNGRKFTMPTADTPAGQLISLLLHSRFHRLRYQQVKAMHSPLDPRLTFTGKTDDFKPCFEELSRRTLMAELSSQATKVPVCHHRVFTRGYFRNLNPPDCLATHGWPRRLEQPQTGLSVGTAQLSDRLKNDHSMASLKHVPFSGL